MRVLVTWGSKRGGTAGIAQIVGEVLESSGFEVVARPAEDVDGLDTVDGVIVGGALYANRWPSTVRRFVQRNAEGLRRVPVWFFSSGPLDDSADRRQIPAPDGVAVLAERVGAREHVTFGGRLEPDAKGFPASAMAKKKSGDWRDMDRVRAWATEIAQVLPEATPGPAVDHPARSVSRLVAYGVVGWGLCASVMVGFLALLGGTAALVIHAAATPLIFVGLGSRYFRARGARDPLQTAAAWTAIVVALDLVFLLGVRGEPEAFASVLGTWLPFALIFLSTFVTGSVLATLPRSDSSPSGNGDGEV